MRVGTGCCVGVEVRRRWNEMRRGGTDPEERKERRELGVPSEDEGLHVLLPGGRSRPQHKH